MSGIAAAVSFETGALDVADFRNWTRLLVEIGSEPDIWADGTVALSSSSRGPRPSVAGASHPRQNGVVRVTADARLDARDDLRRQLGLPPRDPGLRAEDGELIVLAYERWGTDCTDHLSGDYAFVLWDSRLRLLLAATDPFGIKPLYYAPVSGGLLVSNWARALFAANSVSRTLDDSAIVEFLTEGEIRGAATAFQGIRLLPPAHRLVAGSSTFQVQRYWKPPVEEPLIRFREGDYIEEFTEVLSAAVRDRSPTAPVGVLLSGGLDSTTVAAVAAAQRSGGAGVRGYTNVYTHLIGDDEPHFVRLVAQFLRIGVEYQWADEYEPFGRTGAFLQCSPAPLNNPLLEVVGDLFARMKDTVVVGLTGHGTDALFAPEPLARVLGSTPIPRLGVEVARHLIKYRLRPPLGLRQSLPFRTPAPAPTSKPVWLSEEWSKQAFRDPEPVLSHPWRERSYRLLADGHVSRAVCWYTGLAQQQRVACAHPFLDKRLVRFALRLPPIPWCWNKRLLRDATIGRLPDVVRLRPKQPLQGDPFIAWIRQRGSTFLNGLDPGPSARRYLRLSSFAELEPLLRGDTAWVHTRPVALELFLRAWGCDAR